MMFLIHSETDSGSIAANLGASEYSYYFVLKEFRPMLEELGVVVVVADPAREVDRIYRNARNHGEDCVFLTFSPPHKSFVASECPTIPVFAWEFDTMPVETWDDDARQDWRTVLSASGRAITHSAFAVAVVKQAMGQGFPVVSLPAPVWDAFEGMYDPAAAGRTARPAVRIKLRGRVFDTQAIDPAMAARARQAAGQGALLAAAGSRDATHDLVLGGVVYTSVLCPMDGRKNWFDMLCGFVWGLRNQADATLVLKLTHRDCDRAIAEILKALAKLAPFSCRVVLIDGYLPDRSYKDLAAVSTFAVNTSHGEGQCLPLMEYMSAGRPAISPAHTAMADYITPANAFIVTSHLEPTIWPHDPRHALRTCRHRVDFDSVAAAYRDSYEMAVREPGRYARMARAAHDGLRAHCARAVIKARLRAFVMQPDPALSLRA